MENFTKLGFPAQVFAWVKKRWFLILLVGFSLIFIALRLIDLPRQENRTITTALPQNEAGETTLGRVLDPLSVEHPGESGIVPLNDAYDAFAARMLLIEGAERTLDIQYYIWHDDVTGALLFEALRKAAERGVRVRLLLDDINTSGMDPLLAELNAEPNIEIRLFNPAVIRWPRVLSYVVDFSRMNRRMHNKSLTVDNRATIVGGRNIGDEYFGAATDAALFADLDVLAIGAVVGDVSNDFDRYWSSESAYPVERIVPPETNERIKKDGLTEINRSNDLAATIYKNKVRDSLFLQQLLDGHLDFTWAKATLLSDDSKKGLGQAHNETLLVHQFKDALNKAQSSVDLISPYFVPAAAGTEIFSVLAKKGVRVRILTNSFASTDVAAVHAGYAKRRESLLQAGVNLFELQRSSPDTRGNNSLKLNGSSDVSLHAKTFSIDQTRVFVGSFNFDPRSSLLNCEMGIVIEAPSLAKKISDAFENGISQNSYEVRLTRDGEMYWLGLVEGKSVDYTTEPATTIGQRLLIRFLSLLPIEWLL